MEYIQEQQAERDQQWKHVCQPIWSEGVGKEGQMQGRVPLQVQKGPGPQELGAQLRWLESHRSGKSQGQREELAG